MENLSLIDFNYFDIIIASIVLLLAIKGFMHGFIKEIFSLIGLIGGIYFAFRLSGTAAEFIDKNFLHLDNIALLKLLGFLTILIIIWLSATILGSIISKLTSTSGIGFMSRLFGFITGGIKYFLIFSFIIIALSNVSLVKDNLEKYVEDSILYPYLKESGAYLINLNASPLGLESTSTTKVATEVIDNNNTNTTAHTVLTDTNQSTVSE